MTETTEKKSGTEEQLSAELTAVLQLVTIAPAPRTADELANSYAGLASANLWPEQSVESVKKGLAELKKRGKLKDGPQVSEDDKTRVVVLASYQGDE